MSFMLFDLENFKKYLRNSSNHLCVSLGSLEKFAITYSILYVENLTQIHLGKLEIDYDRTMTTAYSKFVINKELVVSNPARNKGILNIKLFSKKFHYITLT